MAWRFLVSTVSVKPVGRFLLNLHGCIIWTRLRVDRVLVTLTPSFKRQHNSVGMAIFVFCLISLDPAGRFLPNSCWFIIKIGLRLDQVLRNLDQIFQLILCVGAIFYFCIYLFFLVVLFFLFLITKSNQTVNRVIISKLVYFHVCLQ